ncbi:MAG TPA: DUF2973 domain-containing protein [Candidatus Caenarcaniphilales bacterium]
MLQLLYMLAFTIIAFLAVSNLLRSLFSFSLDYRSSSRSARQNTSESLRSYGSQIPHPELLDEAGNVINEPLLVMRSVTVEDVREHLDNLYDASP